MGQGINVQVCQWHPVILHAHQYTQESPTLEKKQKYVDHHSQIQPFKGQTLALHFSWDYFKYTSFYRTLFLMPMLLKSSLLFFCQRNANLCQWTKCPLAKLLCTWKPTHPLILDSTCFWEGDGYYFSQLGLEWSLTHSGFCFLKELQRSV